MDRFILDTEVKHSYLNNKKEYSCTEPFRTHKIHNLADDFYTNLISWSKENIAYGICNKVYVFNFHTSKHELIYEYSNKSITSVYYNNDGTKLGIGCTLGRVEVLDLLSLKNKTYKVHRSRVGVIQWEKGCFYTGSRDKSIKMVDERIGITKINIQNHLQEVCGLKLNCTNTMLASGGNDNNVFVYDSRMITESIYSIKNHKAAIKALCFSKTDPYLLLTGGGTADKSVKQWYLLNKPRLIKSIDTNSQVCNLYWTNKNKIISTHGYSLNDSRVLSNNLCVKGVNRGHKNRIIHFAINENEDFYLTGSADSVVNVWKVDDEVDRII